MSPEPTKEETTAARLMEDFSIAFPHTFLPQLESVWLHERIEAALRIAAEQAGDWQSIETAPKDGTRVMWCMAFGSERPFLVIAAWKKDSGGYTIRESDTQAWHFCGARSWRPLPALPTAIEAGQHKETEG